MNLADSDDENEAAFNKKEYKPSNTMNMLEDLVHTRAGQGFLVPKIEAPDLKRQFEESDDEDIQKNAMSVQYHFVGVEDKEHPK